MTKDAASVPECIKQVLRKAICLVLKDPVNHDGCTEQFVKALFTVHGTYNFKLEEEWENYMLNRQTFQELGLEVCI